MLENPDKVCQTDRYTDRYGTPLKLLKPVSVKSRSRQVERALLDLLDNGSLVPGQRLPSELELASQFGVSRATMREAIARLRADGLVSTKPGRGAMVESRSPTTLRLISTHIQKISILGPISLNCGR